MDNMKIEIEESNGSSKEIEKTVKISRKEFEDGSYEEIRVEEVEGGYIKTVCTKTKENGEWKYEDKKSVTTEDPMMDKSSEGIAGRLEAALKKLM